MATRQYVGARYVPKFYDYNGSSAWRSGTEYEALTIVTVNGNSYTSKIPVPSDVGSPDQNPDYWVATGLYNEQVEAYRQLTLAVSDRVNDLAADGAIGTNNLADGAVTNDKVADNAIETDNLADGAVTSDKVADAAIETDNLADGAVTSDKVADGAIEENNIEALTLKKLKNRYVTPEEFGAVGDGVADDTVALQSCIVSGNNVWLKGTYLITRALDFNYAHDILLMGGKITRPVDVTFNTIYGHHCTNISIIGVEFEGNGNDRTSTYTWKDNIQACIILAGQSKNIFVRDCRISNFNYGVFIIGADVENAPANFENTSYNGVIANCVFHNCNSAVDTYGKGIKIEHNTFYDITGDAVQIEPNYSMTISTPNPLNDPNYYTSGVNDNISDNTFINIANIAVLIHANVYGCVIDGNVIIDFKEGITCLQGSKGIAIVNNSLLYQKPQEITSDKRPWNYIAAIGANGALNIFNNYLWYCVVGVKTSGGSNVTNNIFDTPVISAITHLQTSDAYYATLPTIYNGNKVLNHVKNSSAWWGSYAIVIYNGELLFLVNNLVQSDSQPIKAETGVKAYIDNLMSSTEQTTAIPVNDYHKYKNN